MTGPSTAVAIHGRDDVESYRLEPERRAEMLVYDQLSRQLTSDWTVFYDVAWLAPVTDAVPQDGQTDFVIVHPKRGILLLEVKGGAIRHDGKTSTWFSRGKTGEHIIDPINQVKKSKFALLKKLQSLSALDGIHIDIFHAVAFPDVLVPSHTPVDAPKEILIGADDLQYLKEKIESIFDFWKGPQDFRQGALVINRLTDLLSRTVQFPNPLSIQTARDEERILKLTCEQYKTLDQLNRCRKVAIGGCAGSGKTYLAMEKARRLVDEGYRTLITCFNRPLADHLKRLAPESPLLEIDNWHALCRRVALSGGIDLPPFGRGNNDGLSERYAEALWETMEKHPEFRFDAIIVDEGQDFEYEWWGALEACLKTNHGVLYVFYDDNQTLYKGRGTLPDNMAEFILQDNIRNSKPIFQVVSKFYSNDDGTVMRPCGPEGRQVERFTYSNDEDLQRQISKTLSKLIVNEQISSYDVVVLTPKRLERSALLNGKLPGPIQLVSNASDGANDRVLCSTIHSFKGLDRSVVLVAELDDEFASYKQSDLQTRCYVGFSRAKHHLALFGKDNVLDDLMTHH